MSRLSRRQWNWLTGALLTVFGFLALYQSVQWFGIVSALVYWLVFAMCAAGVPLAIMLFGAGVPLSSALGRGHIVLAAVAMDHHYLVELEDRWEWCAGDAERYWFDGKWHPIEDNLENRSLLGWRPFGILRHKRPDTLEAVRADVRASHERAGSADGGSVERAGIEQVNPDPVSGDNGTWLLDLKRVFSAGVQKMGDIEVIETAEEVIERGELGGGRFDEINPVVAQFAGLLLGVVSAYLYFFVM